MRASGWRSRNQLDVEHPSQGDRCLCRTQYIWGSDGLKYLSSSILRLPWEGLQAPLMQARVSSVHRVAGVLRARWVEQRGRRAALRSRRCCQSGKGQGSLHPRQHVPSMCLNPYIACRKDAFVVSDVIMQSSIVTGSEIGALVTAQSHKSKEHEPMRYYIPRSYNQRPNGTY